MFKSFQVCPMGAFLGRLLWDGTYSEGSISWSIGRAVCEREEETGSFSTCLWPGTGSKAVIPSGRSPHSEPHGWWQFQEQGTGGGMVQLFWGESGGWFWTVEMWQKKPLLPVLPPPYVMTPCPSLPSSPEDADPTAQSRACAPAPAGPRGLEQRLCP